MKAIRDNGHEIVAALDPHDSVGILDTYAPGCAYFREPERFDRHLDKLRRAGMGVDYVAVCSPNYLHDAHCRMAMRNGADVICEKPLVLSPWNLDSLAMMERETGRRVWTVLQMRLHPGVASMRQAAGVRAMYKGADAFASLTYVTPRGPWYGSSWKGDESKSGGILANIGIHMFDLLLWVYGPVNGARVDAASTETWATGLLSHEGGTTVSWRLAVAGEKPARILSDPSGACDLSDGFRDAHTRVYAETLAGRGWGIEDARPAVELVYKLRMQRKAAP